MRAARIIVPIAAAILAIVYYLRPSPPGASGPAEPARAAQRAPSPSTPVTPRSDEPEAKPQAGDGRLSGRVVYRDRPVADAVLSLLIFVDHESQVHELEARTGADGRFELSTRPGRMRVLAEVEGRAPGQSRQFRLWPGEAVEDLVIELTDDTTLIVEVRDLEGALVPGAQVELVGRFSWEAEPLETDASGRVTFSGIPPGEGRVRVTSDRFALKESDLFELEPSSSHTIFIELAPMSGVYGFARAPGGKPVPGARVELTPLAGGESLRVPADAQGRFQFDDVAPGEFQLVAAHPRFTPSLPAPVTTPRQEPVDLSLRAGGSIIGTVQRNNGAPVERFTIVIERFRAAGAEANTGGVVRPLKVTNGPGFLFEDLAPGTYDLLADAPEGGPGRAKSVVVVGGSETRGVQIILSDGARLIGTVIDRNTQEPLTKTGIVLQDQARVGRRLAPRQTRTDAEGRFGFSGLAPGTRSLRVSQNGYIAQYFKTPELVAGETTRVTVELARLVEGQPPKTEFFGVGIGIERKADGTLTVQNVLDDGPSRQAGLENGDRILAVDGEPTRDLSLGQAVELIRGEEGTTVHLEVLKEGDSYPTTIPIQRGRVVFDSHQRR